MFLESFTFNDFLIQPASHSRVKSRTQVDTSVTLGGVVLDVPVISSSMSVLDTLPNSGESALVSTKFARAMAEAGSFHIFSRGLSFRERLDGVEELLGDGLLVGMSVGVDEFFSNISMLRDLGAIISIDIANGAIIDEVDWLSDMPLIVGNFANPDISTTPRFRGNVVLKMGIGNGHACSTRVVTGVGAPQAGLIYNTGLNSNYPLISDGGIGMVSDFTKAVALGADVVMTGRMFAHAKESPWEVEEINGKLYKPYRGMASQAEKKTKKFVEGASGYIPYEGKTVQEIMYDFEDGLRSAMAYCDAFTIEEFRHKAKFISSASHHIESSVRILQQ